MSEAITGIPDPEFVARAHEPYPPVTSDLEPSRRRWSVDPRLTHVAVNVLAGGALGGLLGFILGAETLVIGNVLGVWQVGDKSEWLQIAGSKVIHDPKLMSKVLDITKISSIVGAVSSGILYSRRVIRD